MEELDRYQIRMKSRRHALKRLGVNNIHCICGEDDPHCFEVEHVERRKGSDFVWGTCKNCHAKKTAHEATEGPKLPLSELTSHEKIQHALLGMAEYLEAMTKRLRAVASLVTSLAMPGRHEEQ